MKIICIGRNYEAHANELKNPLPEEPIIFLKPDTAILRDNSPFYLPSFAKSFHHEVELVVKINKIGKNIDEKFAHRYYEEIGLGIDFTARDLQDELRTKGLPWELSKAFDNSAVISNFISKSKYENINDINFSLFINDELKQKGNSSEMINNIDKIISFVSKYFSLKIGDLIYTGTPAGVGDVKIGDRLKGFIEGEEMFDFLIK